MHWEKVMHGVAIFHAKIRKIKIISTEKLVSLFFLLLIGYALSVAVFTSEFVIGGVGKRMKHVKP